MHLIEAAVSTGMPAAEELLLSQGDPVGPSV